MKQQTYCNVWELGQNRTDASSIGPVLAQFSFIMSYTWWLPKIEFDLLTGLVINQIISDYLSMTMIIWDNACP